MNKEYKTHESSAVDFHLVFFSLYLFIYFYLKSLMYIVIICICERISHAPCFDTSELSRFVPCTFA